MRKPRNTRFLYRREGRAHEEFGYSSVPVIASQHACRAGNRKHAFEVCDCAVDVLARVRTRRARLFNRAFFPAARPRFAVVFHDCLSVLLFVRNPVILIGGGDILCPDEELFSANAGRGGQRTTKAGPIAQKSSAHFSQKPGSS